MRGAGEEGRKRGGGGGLGVHYLVLGLWRACGASLGSVAWGGPAQRWPHSATTPFPSDGYSTVRGVG